MTDDVDSGKGSVGGDSRVDLEAPGQDLVREGWVGCGGPVADLERGARRSVPGKAKRMGVRRDSQRTP